MKLTYRGVHYDYQPAQVETREGAIEGKYRGAALKFRTTAAKVPVLKSTLDLFYRGVKYQVNPDQPSAPATVLQAPVGLSYRGFNYTLGATQPSVAAQADAVSVAPQADAIADQARVLVMQRRLKDEQREQSVLERFEAAIGASEDAWIVYDRHDAAMS